MKDSRRFLLLMKVVLILLIILSQKGVLFALCDVVRACLVLSYAVVLALAQMTLVFGKLLFWFLVVVLGVAVRTCLVLSHVVPLLGQMIFLFGKLVLWFLVVGLGMIVRACIVLSDAVILALGQMVFLLGKLVFWALVGLGMVVNYGLKYGLWILFDMAFKITHA